MKRTFNKIREKIYHTLNPEYKLDIALKKSLEDSFQNSRYFYVENIRTVRKGLSVNLGLKKESLHGDCLQKDNSRRSFLDYLSPEYEGYKNIYLHFVEYLSYLENSLNKFYQITFRDLENLLILPSVQFEK